MPYAVVSKTKTRLRTRPTFYFRLVERDGFRPGEQAVGSCSEHKLRVYIIHVNKPVRLEQR